MLKRIFDLVIGGLALVLLAPVMLVIAVAVRFSLGSPVIFSQQRPGLHGKIFRMYKFRTMTTAKDDAGNPLSDEQRLTRLGRILRSTSLDELPELFNVVQGSMSLVGPRPLLMEYLPMYSDEEARRHDVKPGITGWAQVNGRNSLSWEEKFALDVWYVDHQSLWLDVRILFLTVWTVLKRDGVSASSHATMPKFERSR